MGSIAAPIFWYNISHMETKLTIDTSRVDPEGETIEGEVDCVDLDEPFVKPFGGVRYVLQIQVFGSELLVRGRLEQDFDLVTRSRSRTSRRPLKSARIRPRSI